MKPVQTKQEEEATTPTTKRAFRYCWEFNGRGQLLNGCRHCAVYRMRAQRCYEVAELQADVGHNRVFCENTCASCEYFKRVHGQQTNVLVVTDDAGLATRLEMEAEKAGTSLNIRVSKCEYDTSALVDSYRPDYAVIDCALGNQESSDISNHLIEDPRIPFVRVILAAREDEMPKECNKEIFARLEKPFGIKHIDECISAAGGRETEVE